MSASGLMRGPGVAADLLGRLRGLLLSFKPSDLSLRSCDAAEEMVIARHGTVAIHQTLAGWSLETCVKGEAERARTCALQRLARYVSGENRDKVRLHVVRPLVQAAEAPGRWRVRIGVAEADCNLVATMVRGGRVTVRATESETLAVIRVPGRPTPLAMRHAETAIRHAIAPTRWEITGPTMIRLHDALPAVLPFLGRFEVAVPVVQRTVGSAMPDWMQSLVPDHRAPHEAPTASSPPVH
jgi:hypothetical protein